MLFLSRTRKAAVDRLKCERRDTYQVTILKTFLVSHFGLKTFAICMLKWDLWYGAPLRIGWPQGMTVTQGGKVSGAELEEGEGEWLILWPAAATLFFFHPVAAIMTHQQDPPLTPTTLEAFDAAWVKHVMSDWFLKYVCSPVWPQQDAVYVETRTTFLQCSGMTFLSSLWMFWRCRPPSTPCRWKKSNIKCSTPGQRAPYKNNYELRKR